MLRLNEQEWADIETSLRRWLVRNWPMLGTDDIADVVSQVALDLWERWKPPRRSRRDPGRYSAFAYRRARWVAARAAWKRCRELEQLTSETLYCGEVL